MQRNLPGLVPGVVLVIAVSGCGAGIAVSGVESAPTHIATSSMPSCEVTPFATLAPNNVVEWSSPQWQQASPHIWAGPYLSPYDAQGAFDGTQPAAKILWWVSISGSQPLGLTIVNAAGVEVGTYSFDAPGPARSDRPSGFPMPPQGCYTIVVTVGQETGSVVERVAAP